MSQYGREIMEYDTCFTWAYLKWLFQSKNTVLYDWLKYKSDTATSKHYCCNNTTRDYSYNWCIHGEDCIRITNPSISSTVRHTNELWFSPNFPRLCWLSARLQTCQLSHFWRDCPTFWACKNKKKRGNSATPLTFQWWQSLLNEKKTENEVNFTWNFYFSIFTSLLW